MSRGWSWWILKRGRVGLKVWICLLNSTSGCSWVEDFGIVGYFSLATGELVVELEVLPWDFLTSAG